MKRADVIDNANIRAGDVVVGLASAGQATYETEYQVPLPTLSLARSLSLSLSRSLPLLAMVLSCPRRLFHGLHQHPEAGTPPSPALKLLAVGGCGDADRVGV